MSRPITKTDFVAGCQCPLRLWNRHHDPIPNDDRVETVAMRSGTNIGVLARQLLPGGVLVDSAPWERDEACSQTKALLANKQVPAIFEAGFLWNGLHVRTDIIRRKRSGGFALYEVKGTARVKDEHLPDLAYQVYVARKAGLPVTEAGIINLDTSYVRGVELDIRSLFKATNQTAQVTEELKNIGMEIRKQRAVLDGEKPAVDPDGHCHSPYTCEFWDRCTAGKPEDWIYYLPGRKQKIFEELRTRAIESIRAIPDDIRLNQLQIRVRDEWKSRKPYISESLRSALTEAASPLSYLDFETVSPAVPVWPGTRPFERIPFQWSLHHRSRSGKISHLEFLADGNDDPRPAFASTLVAALSSSDKPIMVYSKRFEGGVIKDLAARFPKLKRPLTGIADRLWDLLPVVQNHVYFRAFEGSFSIKNVAPVLDKDIDYDGLGDVADGLAASEAFLRLITSEFSEGETAATLRQSLLTYCHLDTLAMIKVHQALERLARQHAN